MYTVGIDIGSVSINCVVVDNNGNLTYEVPYRRHFGRFVPETLDTLQSIYERFGEEHIQSAAFTGNHAKIIASRLGALYEYESITQVLGVLYFVPDASAIIAMGGQDAALYLLTHENGQWYLKSFAMNGPCAAGTGSFIDQQAERLSSFLYDENITFSQEHISEILDNFTARGRESTGAAPVACRCTVFTKSDMIHLQNKGEPLGNIIAGLHQGNAANYVSTIVASQEVQDPVVFIGGVANNDLQVEAFRRYFPQLTVPPHHTSLGALGAALFARSQEQEKRSKPDLTALKAMVDEGASDFPKAPPLRLRKTAFTDNVVIPKRKVSPSAKLHVFLGVDIGSTTTKTVLMDANKNIIHKQYVQTQGKPIEVAQKLLDGIREEFGDGLEFLGTATTGSGRHVVGDFIKADLIIDEITAHARAAVHWEPDVDTVFEIGGQDSKYIWIEQGNPMDFDMNKVCAAGTGSFLHELANKLRINIVREFQDIALSSDSPINLAERCTVFMESDLVSYAQKGARLQDLIAGLCYAIVHNYLNRVVEKRRIGNRVMFLGGPSLNKGIVAAFEHVLDQEIIMPEHREVLGAHGAALSIMEKRVSSEFVRSDFPGLDTLIQATISNKETLCRADKKCHNECKLKIYDFGGRKSIWGGDCGRYEMRGDRKEKEEDWFKKRELIFLDYLKDISVDLPELHSQGLAANQVQEFFDGKITIGIPRALHMMQHSILWSHFWTKLGFAVVLSPKTDQEISVAGIESMTSETCYPIKVFQGHVKTLMGQTSYLFLPTIINQTTPQPEETGFFCPLVQGSQYMASAALNISPASLISPTVYLKEPAERIVLDLHFSLGERFGLSQRQIDRAYREALEVQTTFQNELVQHGNTFLQSLQPNDLWVAVSGRPYNLHDERLSLRLGQNLAKLGIKAVPQDFLDTASVDLSDFPNMFWGLGAQILRTAKLVKAHSGCYGIHLTNFSCGADSFIEHFYRHVMGEKPYLILELDEHSAVAGVVTRLEAFKNVIQNEHHQTLSKWQEMKCRAS
ncbi:MAG: acyl-CoA dehydratase activase [Deltaproteobacteria bacterium]|jgi:predicted CoA-substrate-specific enzyme activase|nr:acyl-CoA dehydratase activase [Deltaproteobacteria bacterium]